MIPATGKRITWNGMHLLRLVDKKIVEVWALQNNIAQLRQMGATLIRVPKYRPPIHPSEMLQEEFLLPMGLTQRDLAAAIHVPYQRVNEIINGKRGITPSTALRLGKFFGMTAAFWLNMQLRWDLYHAQQAELAELEQIHQHPSLPAVSAAMA